MLAYVDVRGLKAVNDTEGHLMGDELLNAVAGLMKESARADDVVGRLGGEALDAPERLGRVLPVDDHGGERARHDPSTSS